MFKGTFLLINFDSIALRSKAFRAERTELFLLCPQQSKQNAWLVCSVAIRGRHAQPQKEPPHYTGQPFVSSFAT